MTQKEQKILLQDLCARLPYDIICEVFDPQQEYEEDVFNAHLIQIDAWTSHCYFWGCSETDPYDIEQVKPYLRPLSSMTDEEINEFILISDTTLWLGNKKSTCILSIEQMNWLNAHHFDYRGLIPMGLAIEVTEENNPYNTRKK